MTVIWKYYEHFKSLDYKDSIKDLRLAIEQIGIDKKNDFNNWTNKTNLSHNDYWILNRIMKSEEYNVKEIKKAHDRIIQNKLKKQNKEN